MTHPPLNSKTSHELPSTAVSDHQQPPSRLRMQGMISAFILIAIQMDSVLCNANLKISQTTVISREGESVSLDCLTSRNEDDRHITWGYVPPGSTTIKWLVSWSPGSTSFTRMSGIETRFSGTKNWSNGRKFVLEINNLTLKDSSRYYCQSGDAVENAADWCGCATTLTVKPAISLRPPSVDLLYPSPEKMSQQTGSKLTCVVRGFYPKRISVSWYIGSTQVSSGITNSGTLMESDDNYTIISELAVTTSQWVSGFRYACVVSHEVLPSPIRREISKDGPIPPLIYVSPTTSEEIDVKKTATDGSIQEPVIHLISPPLDADPAGQTVTMTCLVSDFYPVNISVTWRDENGTVDTGVTQFAVALGSNGTYRTVSQLTVPTAEWESGRTYWCEVKHVSMGQLARKAVVGFEAQKSGGALGMMVLLWIIAVVGSLILIIGIAILVYKKTTSSSRTQNVNLRETLNLATRMESTYENVHYKAQG